jgi:glycosyltransferase involved in cell wall biosynthesis
VDREYFETRVRPLLASPDVDYIGEISDGEKPEFFSGAIALLAPIDWPEPFGLVSIEAMACGTPVVAFNRGAVPEIIEHGLTGFVVEDEASAVAAVARVNLLSRKKIRSRFEDRFTARRMAQDYVEVYRGLIEAAEPRPRLVARQSAARGRLGLKQPQVDGKSASGRVSGSSSQTNAKPQTAMNARP